MPTEKKSISKMGLKGVVTDSRHGLPESGTVQGSDRKVDLSFI